MYGLEVVDEGALVAAEVPTGFQVLHEGGDLLDCLRQPARHHREAGDRAVGVAEVLEPVLGGAGQMVEVPDRLGGVSATAGAVFSAMGSGPPKHDSCHIGRLVVTDGVVGG
ncbi:hypothetical protein ACWGIU_08510 [Streptomyces sp. NPDC054840]